MTSDLKQAGLITPAKGLGGEPWTRQARESDVQHAWFLCYRDSAYPEGFAGRYEPRSLGRMAEDLGFPLATVQGIAESFAWALRAAAFDKAIDERRVEAGMKQAEREYAQHSRALGELHEVVVNELAKLKRQAEGQAPVLRPRELQGLLETVIKYRRLIAGESTENVRVDDGIDYDALSQEEILTLKVLHAKGRRA